MKKDVNGFVKTHSSVLIETLRFGNDQKIFVYNNESHRWFKVKKDRAIKIISKYNTFFRVWADDDVIKIA